VRLIINNRPVRISPRLLYRIPLNLLSLVLNIRPLALPAGIQIEPANRCNLKCNMCPINYLTRERDMLDLDLFKKIIRQVKPPYLVLTGYTEALLHANTYEMIDLASRYGTVKMDTNATLLDEERISRLLRTKLDIVSVSLDSIDPDNYRAIRLGAEVEPVLANIRLLDRMRKEARSPLQLHINAVIQRLNIDDLAGIIRFAGEVDADYVGAGFVSTCGVAEYDELLIRAGDLPGLQESVDRAYDAAKDCGVKANIRHLELLIKHGADYDNIVRINPCYSPWYYAFVSCQGDLFPCCFLFDGQVRFGNLRDEPFKKVWYSKEYTRFRKELRSGKTGYCRGCINGEPELLARLERVPLVRMPHKYADYWPP
jgi:radical SAM protein with 4Fe4S-binding SPASM domain